MLPRKWVGTEPSAPRPQASVAMPLPGTSTFANSPVSPLLSVFYTTRETRDASRCRQMLHKRFCPGVHGHLLRLHLLDPFSLLRAALKHAVISTRPGDPAIFAALIEGVWVMQRRSASFQAR